MGIWSEYEDNILRKYLHTHGRSGLWHLLPGRTPYAIDHRAAKLGLRPRRIVSAGQPDIRPISDEDLKRLRENAPPDTRDLTGRIFGDPLPERSALAQKSLTTEQAEAA